MGSPRGRIYIASPIRGRIALTPGGRADVIHVPGRRIGVGRRTARLVRGVGQSPISLVRRTALGDGGSGVRPGRGIRPIRRPALVAGRIFRILRVIQIAHGGCGIIPRKTLLVGWG